MRFFTDLIYDKDVGPAEIQSRFDAYGAHLERIRPRIPIHVYEFAAASWHYDDGTQGLHDSWVESLIIEEPSSGARSEQRSIEIRVKLLSAYHDRVIGLKYKNVRKYELQTPPGFKELPGHTTSHGDWLYDEFDVSEEGFVIHEVRFSLGSTWLIECSDIEIESTRLKRDI